MLDDFAEKLFLGQEKGYPRLNCAQAIAEAFKENYDFITDKTVTDFKKKGYGKAPKGECGMLYAAKFIFENNGQPEKIKEIEQEFLKFAGSTKCKEIKKKKIDFCAFCIKKTAEFINKAKIE